MGQAEVMAQLASRLPWHKARLKFLASFIVAILQVKTVNLSEIATALNPTVKVLSSYRRLQRFFAKFELEDDLIARWVMSLIPRPQSGYCLVFDRTTWFFGRTPLNLLVLAVSYHGVAFPVYWLYLPHQGNSDTLHRVMLLELFISTFGKNCIDTVLADREFVGEEWFTYLHQQQLRFVIRLKANFIATHRQRHCSVKRLFAHLAVKQSQTLKRRYTVLGVSVYLAGLRLSQQDWLIVATTTHPHTMLQDYARRWTIETLFGCLKSRGFRFEETHLTDPDRLSKMVALLTLLTLWAFKVGQWQHTRTPVQKKKHGRPAKSLFRLGLDALRTCVFGQTFNAPPWLFFLKILSCT